MHRPLLNMGPLTVRLALVLAFALVLVAPFAAMEAVNSSHAQAELPVLLFTFMFVHAALIAAAVSPAVQQALRTQGITSLSLLHWLGVLAGLILLSIYVGVVLDQMPCFLGVPNCD
jgi:hypothetical protein